MVEFLKQQGSQGAAQILRHQQHAFYFCACTEGLVEQVDQRSAIVVVECKEHPGLGLAQCLAQNTFGLR